MFPCPATRLLLGQPGPLGFPLSDHVRATLPQALTAHIVLWSLLLLPFLLQRCPISARRWWRMRWETHLLGRLCGTLPRSVPTSLSATSTWSHCRTRRFFVTLPRGRSDVDDSGDACPLRALHGSPRELPSEPLSARDIVHLRAAGWAWKDYMRCGLWFAFFFFFLAGSLEPGPLCRTGSETLDDWRHGQGSGCGNNASGPIPRGGNGSTLREEPLPVD